MGSLLFNFLAQEPAGFAVSPEMIVAVGAILTAIFTYFSSKSAEKRTAKKDEVQLLRDEVNRLQERVDDLTAENESWRLRYEYLYTYVLLLRKLMMDSNIEVPEIPPGVMTLEKRIQRLEETKPVLKPARGTEE